MLISDVEDVSEWRDTDMGVRDWHAVPGLYCTVLCNAAPDCWQRPLWSPPPATPLKTVFVQNSQFANILPSQRETAAARIRTQGGGFARYFCSCWHEMGYCSPETLPKNVTALVLFFLWFHEKLKLSGAESSIIYRGCICGARESKDKAKTNLFPLKASYML